MSKRTFHALLQRGISSNIARQLIEKGMNISKLKQMSKAELLALDIPKDFADKILGETRPPIPEKTVCKLLIDSKFTCCICRDSSKEIIIHHINAWKKLDPTKKTT